MHHAETAFHTKELEMGQYFGAPCSPAILLVLALKDEMLKATLHETMQTVKDDLELSDFGRSKGVFVKTTAINRLQCHWYCSDGFLWDEHMTHLDLLSQEIMRVSPSFSVDLS